MHALSIASSAIYSRVAPSHKLPRFLLLVHRQSPPSLPRLILPPSPLPSLLPFSHPLLFYLSCCHPLLLSLPRLPALLSSSAAMARIASATTLFFFPFLLPLPSLPRFYAAKIAFASTLISSLFLPFYATRCHHPLLPSFLPFPTVKINAVATLFSSPSSSIFRFFVARIAVLPLLLSPFTMASTVHAATIPLLPSFPPSSPLSPPHSSVASTAAAATMPLLPCLYG